MKDDCRQYQEYIARMYGTSERQREGFPHILISMLVSCKSGRGINELRDALFDVASQVKENTGGCGFRSCDYHMTYVPLSYWAWYWMWTYTRL